MIDRRGSVALGAAAPYGGRMAELKTTRNDASVADFLAAVPDPRRRADAEAACALLADATGATPEMWGTSLVGFGAYRYRYGTGRENEWPPVSMSPRRQALTVYLATGFESSADLLERLGPHDVGRSCLHIKRLADIDQAVLRELVLDAFQELDGKAVVTGSGA